MTPLFGVSLTASFLGGMVALFAPCCITFLFPSYLGTIFKERRRVVFLTLVFALGLGSVLVPVAMGMKAIVSLFDEYHTLTYLIGAATMAAVGLMTLFEIRLSLPVPHYVMPQKTTVVSTYLLGLVSGITSSCCAPVLFAAVTLSSLSPSLLTAFIVAVVYVMGIVFPLFFLSLFYEKLTNQHLYRMRRKVERPLKLASAATFLLSSVIITALALSGRITMDQGMGFGTELRLFIYRVSSWGFSPILDVAVVALIAAVVVYMAKEVRYERQKKTA